MLEGISAINPFTGLEIPIWISDYVLATYGTGAIMGVPGHDQRDYEFTVFNMPIIQVVDGDISEKAHTSIDKGTMINSGILNGLTVQKHINKAISYAVENGLGRETVNYKLRSWVFTRQRYWEGQYLWFIVRVWLGSCSRIRTSGCFT